MTPAPDAVPGRKAPLCAPRGWCAGMEIVVAAAEKARERYGIPGYAPARSSATSTSSNPRSSRRSYPPPMRLPEALRTRAYLPLQLSVPCEWNRSWE